MRPSFMVSAPAKEWKGRAIDLDGHLELCRSWGLTGLDVFQPFVDAAGGPQRLVERLAAHGLCAACVYVGVDLVVPTTGTADPALEGVRKATETCHTLGTSLLFTYGCQHGHSGAEALSRYVDRLGAATQIAAAAGLTFVIENAGRLLHRADDIQRVLAQVGNPHLKFALDTGNFFLWAQDEVAATRLLMPQTVHFHIKEYSRRWDTAADPNADGAELGHGAVRHDEVLAIVRQAGYNGALAFESTVADPDVLERSIRRLVQWCGPANG